MTGSQTVLNQSRMNMQLNSPHHLGKRTKLFAKLKKKLLFQLQKPDSNWTLCQMIVLWAFHHLIS